MAATMCRIGWLFAPSERAYDEKYIKIAKLCGLLLCDQFMLSRYFVKDQDEDRYQEQLASSKPSRPTSKPCDKPCNNQCNMPCSNPVIMHYCIVA